MSKSFSNAKHDNLLDVLAGSTYVSDYIAFCAKYTEERDIEGPRLDMERTARIFQDCGIACKLNKRFKVFVFDGEDIDGWRWEGSLVVKRYDMLEPMIEGTNLIEDEAVGSTFLRLAGAAGERRRPPITISPPLPRPEFNGDMRSMERMIPDLVQLFRSMKNAVRANRGAFAARVPEPA